MNWSQSGIFWATICMAFKKAKYIQRKITKYLSGCQHDWILSGGGIGKLPIPIQLSTNG